MIELPFYIWVHKSVCAGGARGSELSPLPETGLQCELALPDAPPPPRPPECHGPGHR